jgi:hypothetical protein
LTTKQLCLKWKFFATFDGTITCNLTSFMNWR